MFGVRAILPITVLALSLAACGGEAKVAQTAAPSAPAATTSATGTPAVSTTPAADVVEIKVSVASGKVIPRTSIHKIKQGQTVRILVTVDKADEVHVHGYDIEKELGAGETGTIEFKADETGRFEVETHKSALQLFQLEVD
jgi:hypothetical protein